MKTFYLPTRKLYLSSAFALLSSMASAQSVDPSIADRVEVSGQKASEIVKFNVTQTCQNISVNLQDALASQWFRHQATGQVRVDFKLTGNEVSDVRTRGGPREYSQSIKRAVRQLSCDGAQARPENYAFIIDFIDPDQPPSERAQVASGQGQEPGQIGLLAVGAR